jgi:hypothetical protein
MAVGHNRLQLLRNELLGNWAFATRPDSACAVGAPPDMKLGVFKALAALDLAFPGKSRDVFARPESESGYGFGRLSP